MKKKIHKGFDPAFSEGPEPDSGSEKKEKKERSGSSLNSRALRISLMVRGRSSEKASLWSRRAGARRASLTIESACVLPLYLFGLITLIFFMDLYRAETVHLTALCQQAKEAGVEAFSVDGGPEEVTREEAYSWRPVQLLLPIPPVPVTNRITVHAWTGSDSFGGGSPGSEPDSMVYVTETGHVIHRDAGCSYLRLTVRAVAGSTVSSLRNSGGETYHACERCSYHQAPAGVVYITEQGNRYHNQGSCSGLKRTVRLVRESDVEGMPDCSRCGNG